MRELHSLTLPRNPGTEVARASRVGNFFPDDSPPPESACVCGCAQAHACQAHSLARSLALSSRYPQSLTHAGDHSLATRLTRRPSPLVSYISLILAMTSCSPLPLLPPSAAVAVDAAPTASTTATTCRVRSRSCSREWKRSQRHQAPSSPRLLSPSIEEWSIPSKDVKFSEVLSSGRFGDVCRFVAAFLYRICMHTSSRAFVNALSLLYCMHAAALFAISSCKRAFSLLLPQSLL